MTDTASLLRLMSWLSPAFPTGGFAYSAGLEQAVADGLVNNADALHEWLVGQLHFGSMRNDAAVLAHCITHHADSAEITLASETLLALATANQRRKETLDQGTSFLAAAQNWLAKDQLPPTRKTPLPVAVGVASGGLGIAAHAALPAFLHAFVSSQLQCAIRLAIIGQSQAAALLAKLEPTIEETAKTAATTALDEIGTFSPMADLAAMKHETLQPRLFKS